MVLDGYFHSSYTVGQLDRSIYFYQDILGIDNARSQVSDQAYLASVTGIPGASLRIGFLNVEGDKTLIELVEYVRPKGERANTGFGIVGSPHLCWSVDNLDLAIRRLVEAGAIFCNQAQTVGDGLWSEAKGIFLTDPDGLLIELLQFSGKQIGTGHLTGMHHTGFTVSHMETALHIFVDLLGLELIQQFPFTRFYPDIFQDLNCGYPRVAYLRLPKSEHLLELWEFSNPIGKPASMAKNHTGSAHMCFEVADIFKVHKNLSARGIKFAGLPTEVTAGRNKGAFAIYLEGPDGIPLELFQKPPLPT